MLIWLTGRSLSPLLVVFSSFCEPAAWLVWSLRVHKPSRAPSYAASASHSVKVPDLPLGCSSAAGTRLNRLPLIQNEALGAEERCRLGGLLLYSPHAAGYGCYRCCQAESGVASRLLEQRKLGLGDGDWSLMHWPGCRWLRGTGSAQMV